MPKFLIRSKRVLVSYDLFILFKVCVSTPSEVKSPFLTRPINSLLIGKCGRVYLGVKLLLTFFFVSLARAGVWLLFIGLLALLLSLFYVIREFHRFLHRR